MTLKTANNDTSGRVPGPAGAGDNDAVWKTMIASFGALSLSTVTAAKKRRLPFLRRIVRTSFLRRFQMMGLAVNSVSPRTQPLTILYKMPIDISENEWDDEVTEYAVHKVKLTLDQLVCPLCDILGRLNTKEMLEVHLEWDHLEVETSWRKKKNGNWELVVELPSIGVLADEWEEAESSRSSSPHPSARLWSPVGTFPVSETDYGGAQAAAHENTTSIEDSIPVFKFKPEISPTPASRTASLVPGPSRDCLQQAPSALDPLGALRTHPDLSSSMRDDNYSLGFSCRPCGPRLFDLVARDSISDYGLTSWSLLERDEELFEIDDVRDEEKAIQAMWNRWIFFQRRCLDLILNVCHILTGAEKSVPPRSTQNGDRILGSFQAHRNGNGRVEGCARMAFVTS
ncbi:hypothetical protein DFH94DRAFT_462959 [Russula ochroleuca]|uniref:Uncharacterized protein n=1 Tax=Russula ochroleuca TaxID=152965 RepID=A0A9P5MW57_9AGAM|nr:hypothetical protein DFH94DRAFT_462959 [Russula ochroleuca]